MVDDDSVLEPTGPTTGPVPVLPPPPPPSTTLRLWRFLRRDWPTSIVFALTVLVGAILARQVKTTLDLRHLIRERSITDDRVTAQSCKDRNDAREVLRTVLQGLIADPATSEGGRAILSAQLPKVAPIDCADNDRDPTPGPTTSVP